MPPNTIRSTTAQNTSVTFIVTDLYVPEGLRETLEAETGDGGRVRLPALELWLTRASARTAGGWRELAGSIADVAFEETAPAGGVPVAAVVMAGTAEPGSSEQWWVVTPVYLQAAHDHVQLAEILSLDGREWKGLLDGFDREFGAEFGRLHNVSTTQACLLARRPYDAVTVDPARVSGRDVHDSLPRGASGGELRRLMTELQMWLHGHEVNAVREARGQPPVNGLWVWGGGRLPRVSGRNALPDLYADERFLRGLWSMRDATAQSAPASADGRRRLLQDSARSSLVAVSLSELPGESWQQRLASLDREWLAPALDAMRRGGPKTMKLQANDALWTLRERDLWRVWRRPRPWLEVLA